MSNNNQPAKSDFSCRFGETLIAVLYDEASEIEQRDFADHLNQCAACSSEVAAFGLTRAAITDWRNAEFASLVTPEITLPKNAILKATKISLIEQIKNFLLPGGKFFPSVPAFATVLICACLVTAFAFFIFQTGGKINQAINNDGLQIPVPNPESLTTPPAKNEVAVLPSETDKTVNANVPSAPTPQTSPSPVKTEKPRAKRRSGTANKEKKPASSPKSKRQTEEDFPLDLFPDDADDDLPRLTDLLDDGLPSDD